MISNLTRQTFPYVEQFKARLLEAWWSAGEETPPLGPEYTDRERITRERYLYGFLNRLAQRLDRTPQNAAERLAL